jgi:hypothetical protein
MMTVTEIRNQAERLQGDLEVFRLAVERSPLAVETKSALARDIFESQERVAAVVRACTPAYMTVVVT